MSWSAWGLGSGAPSLAASRTTPSPGRGNACELGVSQRLFVPADIPVAVELAPLLCEMGDPLEPHPLVQRDRGLVRQSDPGVRPMQVLPLELLEELFVEFGSDAAPHRVGSEVDAGLDGGLVCGLGPPATAGCVTDDRGIRNSDQDSIPPGSVVMTEPLTPGFDRHRLDVKREVGLDHIPVVDVVELAQVLLRGGPHRDFAVAQLQARRLRITPPSLFRPPGPSGPGAKGARINLWTGSCSRACRSAAGMESASPSASMPKDSRSTSRWRSTCRRRGERTCSPTPSTTGRCGPLPRTRSKVNR